MWLKATNTKLGQTFMKCIVQKTKHMKKQISRVLLGVIISIAVMGVLFYFFIFLNPLGIHGSNTLKWIPVLVAGLSLYFSGRINQNTSAKLLPVLFIPLILLKPFNFFYFPFIIIIFIIGVLSLVVTLKIIPTNYKKISWTAMVAIFLYFLLSQPLILEKKESGYDDEGELVNAIVLWDFTEKKGLELPDHFLLDRDNLDFNMKSFSGKTYFISFWATWCAPCMKNKPELEKLKKEFKYNSQIEFIDVSFDGDRERWLQYIVNTQPMGLQLISENQQKTGRALNFAGIPMHFIVKPDGSYKEYRSFQVAKKALENSLNSNIPKSNSSLEKIDKYLDTIEYKNQGMGSISFFQNGKEIYTKTFGFSNVKNHSKPNKGTKYRIGSITKTFTAVIIMQLIDEGKLSMETRLDNFFPDIPNASNITIESLLRHRSGLYDVTKEENFASWIDKPQTKKQMLNRFVKNGITFNVNERKEYSNTNYILLSYIAEKIENTTYAGILQTRITEPCNLKDTYYGGKINNLNNEALSYKMQDDWELTTETDMSIPAGAGGIVSTPTDLNIFYSQLFSGKLVSHSSLLAMTEIIDGAGIGMSQLPFPDKLAYGHPGSIDGFNSVTAYFPEEKLGATYVTNGEVLPLKSIFFTALNIFFNNDPETIGSEK
jgi:D-alanyl-D-alanine carboxypeptidase